MLLREKVRITFPHRLLRIGQSESLGQPAADADESALLVLEVYAVRGVIQERAEEKALVVERCLDGLLLGDFPENRLGAGYRSIPVPGG